MLLNKIISLLRYAVDTVGKIAKCSAVTVYINIVRKKNLVCPSYTAEELNFRV